MKFVTETCCNGTDTIRTQFWKTSMKRQFYDADRVSEARRIPDRTAKKFGRSYEVNESSSKEYEEAI